ncbi:hypothetical protein ACWEPC_03315 [Nonomuraea sp. NPDC004297]
MEHVDTDPPVMLWPRGQQPQAAAIGAVRGVGVAARSMRHREEVSGRIGGLGSVTTSVVHSSPLPRRTVGH